MEALQSPFPLRCPECLKREQRDRAVWPEIPIHELDLSVHTYLQLANHAKAKTLSDLKGRSVAELTQTIGEKALQEVRTILTYLGLPDFE